MYSIAALQTENKLLVFIGIFLVIDVVLVIIWFSVDPWTTGTRPLEVSFLLF